VTRIPYHCDLPPCGRFGWDNIGRLGFAAAIAGSLTLAGCGWSETVRDAYYPPACGDTSELSRMINGPFEAGPVVAAVAYDPQKYGGSAWVEAHNETDVDLVLHFFLAESKNASLLIPRKHFTCPRVLVKANTTELLQLPVYSEPWRYIATGSGHSVPQRGAFAFVRSRRYIFHFRKPGESVTGDESVPIESALRGVSVQTLEGITFTDYAGKQRRGDPRVVVTRVERKSPGEAVGLRVGDWVAEYSIWNNDQADVQAAIISSADFYDAASICVPNCSIYRRKADALTTALERMIIGPRTVAAAEKGGYGPPITPITSIAQAPMQSATVPTPSPTFVLPPPAAGPSGLTAGSVALSSSGVAACSVADGYQTVLFSDGSVYSGSFQNCRPLPGQAQFQQGSTILSGYVEPLDDHTVRLRTETEEVTITLQMQPAPFQTLRTAPSLQYQPNFNTTITPPSQFVTPASPPAAPSSSSLNSGSSNAVDAAACRRTCDEAQQLQMQYATCSLAAVGSHKPVSLDCSMTSLRGAAAAESCNKCR
jgi:hypothetical protein